MLNGIYKEVMDAVIAILIKHELCEEADECGVSFCINGITWTIYYDEVDGWELCNHGIIRLHIRLKAGDYQEVMIIVSKYVELMLKKNN